MVIDRETNLAKGPHLVKRESEDQISSLPSDLEPGDCLNLLLQLDVHFHTHLKLNLIDFEGNHLIPDS